MVGHELSMQHQPRSGHNTTAIRQVNESANKNFGFVEKLILA
jgi:hypothetical protein